MASQLGVFDGERVDPLWGGADADESMHSRFKKNKKCKKDKGKSGKIGKHGKHVKMVDESGLSLDERTAKNQAAHQAHVDIMQHRVTKKTRRLQALLTDQNHDPAKANKLRTQLATAARELSKRARELGPTATELIGNETSEPREEQDDAASEDLEEPVDKLPSRSKKRRLSQAFHSYENGGGPAVGYSVKGVVVMHDTPKKEKKEKKKRKKDKSSQDSSVPLNSIPAFDNESETTTTEDSTARKNAISVRKDGENTAQRASATPPTSDKAKQDALRATITKARSPAGGDKIFDALIAGAMGIQSLAENKHESLIAVGQAAMAAPPPGIQSPRVQMGTSVASKVIAPTAHKESPIPPPQRNFSAIRIVPGVKPAHDEKKKPKSTKDTESGKGRSGKDSGKADGESQESATLSQTVRVLKEAASATVINGIFSQADPVTTTAPGPAPKRPRALSFPNHIESSSPANTPTKVRISKDNEANSSLRKSTKSHHSKRDKFGKRIEGKAEDWELESGRVRARIAREGNDDDGETEENIAFSSTYLASRPLGISISGTKFRVLQIGPGTEQELPIHTSKEKKAAGIKICSVANGRVEVLVGGKKFAIGEGGMWRVRSGEKCVVANQLGSQDIAAVHVSTIEV